MQSKKSSVFEAIVNTVVGLLSSLLIQCILYPIMDIPVTFGQNLIITMVFFVVSFTRSYLLRRLFNRIK